MPRVSLLLIVLACTQQPQARFGQPTPVQPTSPQSVSDSIVAAVLYHVVTHGLPDFHPIGGLRTIVVRNDSDIVSSASIPSVDSVGFVLLDSIDVQRLANRIGHVNVIGVGRPIVQDDTAHAGATSHVVWRPERLGRMVSMSACMFRVRRTNARWQVDSTLMCIIS